MMSKDMMNRQSRNLVFTVMLVLLLMATTPKVHAFTPSSKQSSRRSAVIPLSTRLDVSTQQETATETAKDIIKEDVNNHDENSNNEKNNLNSYTYVNKEYWEIGSTMFQPISPSLAATDDKLRVAIETNTHPIETQDELGYGKYITGDWRSAFQSYGHAVGDTPGIIDIDTGYAEYNIDRIEDVNGAPCKVPGDLVGVLYRNGPGKFGPNNNDRVLHPLDADGLITQLTFPEPTTNGDNDERVITFRSRFIETKEFKEELRAQKFVYRGTFGTGPYVDINIPFFNNNNNINNGKKDGKSVGINSGINKDPIKPSLISRLLAQCLNVNLKNPANTQVISFGGKVLALFEAGLPYSIDPITLKTIGEDTLNGILSPGLPVKMAAAPDDSNGFNIPDEYLPDFIGGTAHTAHPKMCPYTNNLVGWYWSGITGDGKNKSTKELTFVEWSSNTKFKGDNSATDDDDDTSKSTPVASTTFTIENCGLAPHDMSLTRNCIMLVFNAMEMNDLQFLLGIKGAAESLKMAGRSPINAWIAPRPTSKNQFEPFRVELPPCFTIHCSHSYEDEITGNIVAYYTGWPPSDNDSFLGAWGGFAPDFGIVPVTYLWRIEIDPIKQKCISFDIAPGCANACIEHAVVHPNFIGKKVQYVYALGSNVIGDSSAAIGVVKLNVETGSTDKLQPGEYNTEIDAYWYGTRYNTDEPLIAPKHGGDITNERDAYLIQLVKDAVEDKSFYAIFDLEKDLKNGPICKVWLKNAVPHGLHGCFAPNGGGKASYFC